MFQSEQINELAKALAAAQAEMKQPGKNAKNPHFGNRYADLNEIIVTATPVLAKHGLSVTQTTSFEGGVVVLRTTLMHVSGQWISGSYPVVPVKPDPQGYGSAMTYARRYSLSAMVGLAADDDDDGEAASGSKTFPAPAAAKAAAAPKADKPAATTVSKPAPVTPPTSNGSGKAKAQPAAAPAAVAEIEDLDAPDAPAANPGDFIVPMGKNAGKKLSELPRETVAWYANELKPTSEQGVALQAAAKAYLAQLG